MITTLRKWLRLGRDERGVTAIEYGLIAAFMAAVIVAAMTLLGPGLMKDFSGIATTLGTNVPTAVTTPAS